MHLKKKHINALPATENNIKDPHLVFFKYILAQKYFSKKHTQKKVGFKNRIDT